MSEPLRTSNMASVMEDRAKKVLLPSADCDILIGLTAIAAWLGVTYGTLRAMIANRLVPVYSQPGKSTRYARKSEIISTMERMLKKVEPQSSRRQEFAIDRLNAPRTPKKRKGEHSDGAD